MLKNYQGKLNDISLSLNFDDYNNVEVLTGDTFNNSDYKRKGFASCNKTYFSDTLPIEEKYLPMGGIEGTTLIGENSQVQEYLQKTCSGDPNLINDFQKSFPFFIPLF